jgi:hypothetical protein
MPHRLAIFKMFFTFQVSKDSGMTRPRIFSGLDQTYSSWRSMLSNSAVALLRFPASVVSVLCS